MIPVRVLIVEESHPWMRGMREELESSGGFEVYTAASPAAGMLSLARLQPDLLVANPYAGRGTAEEWRRAVMRYRSGRSLNVLIVADRVSDHDREILTEVADLGVQGRGDGLRVVESILCGLAALDEEVEEAA